MKLFNVQVPAKWILAGEHAVLRGETAVALPHPDLRLELSHEPTDFNELLITPAPANKVISELLGALEDDWQEKGVSFPRITGRLKIESTIPIGAGLGSSAALCVALTRWLTPILNLDPSGEREFATRLEHRFHGQSSGLDVAVIALNQPIRFSISKGAEPLEIEKLPQFTFHDTGQRSRTSDCVLRVQKFRSEQPASATRIDEAMGLASRKAIEGLLTQDPGLLAEAMKEAQECFYSWELVSAGIRRMELELIKQGALGVKLTGAGGGGMLVALWPNLAPNIDT